MPCINTTVSCRVQPSFRAAQLAGMFDLPPAETIEERFSVELPDEAEPWQIGLIVGPSGSGKTTVARAAYGRLAGKHRWPAERAVVDCFPRRRSIKEITAILTAVGFSSPPAWLKPYQVLSGGERFRCDLARALLTRERRVVFDEFTSVVDRTVARIGSAAVAKAVRRMPGKQFVAVTCHYDVAEWLEPDWMLDMGSVSGTLRVPLADGTRSVPGTLSWRSLRRPELRIGLYRSSPDAWPLFARHHYLNAALNRSAHCYVGVLESRPEQWPRSSGMEAEETIFCRNCAAPVPAYAAGKADVPVAFCAVLNAIGRRGVWRVSRIVVLPDYQGIGIGRATLAAVAELYPRLRITTGHPAMLRALAADPQWQLDSLRRAGYTRQPRATEHARFHGGVIASSSAGRCVGTFEWKQMTER